jgi:ureidoglycolate hydrolase
LTIFLSPIKAGIWEQILSDTYRDAIWHKIMATIQNEDWVKNTSRPVRAKECWRYGFENDLKSAKAGQKKSRHQNFLLNERQKNRK